MGTEGPASAVALRLLCDLHPSWAIAEMKKGLWGKGRGTADWENAITRPCFIGLAEVGTAESLGAFEEFVAANGLGRSSRAHTPPGRMASTDFMSSSARTHRVERPAPFRPRCGGSMAPHMLVTAPSWNLAF